MTDLEVMGDVEMFFRGFAMGFILAVTIPPGTFWLVQLGVSRNWKLAAWAGVGLASGHAFLALGVAICLLMVEPAWPYLVVPFRVLASAILMWLAWQAFRSRGADRITLPSDTALPAGAWGMVKETFYILVTMPMRVPLAFAYIVATALLFRFSQRLQLIDLTLGVAVGAWGWTLFICLLGRMTAHKVEPEITLTSLNKLYRFSGYVFVILLVFTLLPLAS